MAKLFQFAPQFEMVVDFAVEDDGDVAIIRQDWLVAGTEVDNLEPSRAHRAEARFEDALLVRPAMNQSGRGATNALGIRYPMFVGESNDSTQVSAPLPLQETSLQLPQISRRRDSANQRCQRFRLNSNPNLLTMYNQEIGANLL